MKMSVSEFKAKCTWVLREVSEHGFAVEITNRGRTVAVVQKPAPAATKDPRAYWGSLAGSCEASDDIVAPAADAAEWDANR